MRANMSKVTDMKCLRCQQALSVGSGYCVSCGFQNIDIEAKKYRLEQKSRRRADRARALSKFYRLMWFGGLFR